MRATTPVFLLLLLSTALSAPSPAVAGVVCGDVNASGSVNASDALGVLQRGVGQDNVLRCDAPGQPVRTGQFQDYGAGSDGNLKNGAPRTFRDNGDGTITDFGTGLMWEKKDRSDGPHFDLNDYTWSSDFSGAFNGTVVTEFLAALNAGDGFAGHTDWRLPSRAELATVQNLALTSPSAHAPFTRNCVDSCSVETCGCLLAKDYWTSTSSTMDPSVAWVVGFVDGEIYKLPKILTNYAMAVRTADAAPNAPTCQSPDPPQCLFNDPCTEGVCSISREPCVQQANCPLAPGEQCCCSGSCL